MEQITKNTWRKRVDGTDVYQVKIGTKKYQECLVCDSYFELTGYNQKYCPKCAKKVNLEKTGKRNLAKYYERKAHLALA